MVENQRTSVTDLAEALERFQQSGIGDTELSRSVQMGLRASLVRRFLTEDLDYINTAKHYLARPRLLRHRAARHLAGRARAASWAARARACCSPTTSSGGRRSTPTRSATFKIPKTWYVSSDGLLAFLDHNHLQDIHNRKYLEIEQVRHEYPHIVQAFKNSEFPKEILKGLAVALDDIGDKPLVVRSSSLLEDRIGSAFSGKYKSLFLANRGTKRERMAASSTPSRRSTRRSSARIPSSTAPSAACSTSTRRWAS